MSSVNLYKIARSYYSEQVHIKHNTLILSKSATDRKLACDTAGLRPSALMSRG